MIIGRDLLMELGIDISFSKSQVQWDKHIIPLKNIDCTENDSYHVREEGTLDEATTRIKQILDAKYKKANLDNIASSQNHLNKEEKDKLLRLLRKYESLFNGTLGKWHSQPYNVELKPISCTPISHTKNIRKDTPDGSRKIM